MYVDVTSSLGFLKKYLKYRDNEEVYAKHREVNSLGLPCLVLGNGEEFYFNFEEFKPRLEDPDL